MQQTTPHESSSAHLPHSHHHDSTNRNNNAHIAASRGIVYTGDYNRLKAIYQSILALRLLNCTLPVEIWVSTKDMPYCENMLISRLRRPGFDDSVEFINSAIDISASTRCKILPDIIGSYSYKFYAVLSTSFTDVLYLDADNIPLRNVNELFDSKEYKAFGAILWPDKCGERCYDGSSDLKGFTAYRNHVFFASGLGAMKWIQNDRKYSQEVDSGQILLNMQKHGLIVELARKLMEDDEFITKYVHGDKDLWRLAFLMVGRDFYFVPHSVGLSYSVLHQQRDCITHYFGIDDLNPIFCHQPKQRDKDSLANVFRVSYSQRSPNVSSLCIRRLNTFAHQLHADVNSVHVDVKIQHDDQETFQGTTMTAAGCSNSSSSSCIHKDKAVPHKAVPVVAVNTVLPNNSSRKRYNWKDFIYRDVPMTAFNGSSSSSSKDVGLKVTLENSSLLLLSPNVVVEMNRPIDGNNHRKLRGKNYRRLRNEYANVNEDVSNDVAKGCYDHHSAAIRVNALQRLCENGTTNANKNALPFNNTENNKINVVTIKQISNSYDHANEMMIPRLYSNPNDLIIEHPTQALKNGELLGVVFATVDETWPNVDRKSCFLIMWEVTHNQFIMWLKMLHMV